MTNEQGVDMDAAVWLVRTLIAFPMRVLGNSGQGLPEKIEFASLLGEPREVRLGDTRARLVSYEDQTVAQHFGLQPGTETVELRLLAAAETPEEALASTRDLTTEIIDDLGFRLLQPVWPLQVTVVDVTPPIRAGDQRRMAMRVGLGSGKFASSTLMEQHTTEPAVQLRDEYGYPDRYVSRAIDWFLKGLASLYDADRFLSFWVATEIMARDAPKVRVPYTGPKCGHEIHECPQCGESLMKPMLGPSMKAYLVSRGVSQEDAEAMWKLRQIVHGSRDLDDEALAELPRFIQLLKATVLAEIKAAQQIPTDDPPGLVPGPAVGQMGLGGEMTLDGHELDEWNQ